MKIYKVKVNGKVYEVELESVTEQVGSVVADKPVAKEEVVAPTAPVASGEGTPVKAPMQGTILKINVQVGDRVKVGQAVAVLEAMKMENDIVAPVEGTVASIQVSKGQTVNNQDVLLIVR